MITCYCIWCVTSLSSGEFDATSVAGNIGGVVGGSITFAIIITLLIITLWCVRLSHKRKLHPTGKSSSILEYEVELNVTTQDFTTIAKMKLGKNDFSSVLDSNKVQRLLLRWILTHHMV